MSETEIILPWPPSGNNLYVNASRGRRKSSRYSKWIVEAGTELMTQRPLKHAGAVLLHMTFGLPDKRRRDCFNLVKPVEDLLVRHQVIQDDNCTFVKGGNVRISNEFVGVKIQIEPLAGMA